MRVKGGHVSTLLSLEEGEGDSRREERERERERKTERETRETKEETTYYFILVSRSVRSELDETCDFGWTTFPFPRFLVPALVVKLLRIDHRNVNGGD